MSTSAFGVEHEVAKAYTPGAITYHNESARMHGRKKHSGYRQVAVGAGIGSAGAAVHQHADRIGRAAVGMGKPSKYLSETMVREAKAAHTVRRIGVGGMVAGGALVAVGAGRAMYHGHKQNAQTKKAQNARVERAAEFDERDAEREHKAQHGIAKGDAARQRLRAQRRAASRDASRKDEGPMPPWRAGKPKPSEQGHYDAVMHNRKGDGSIGKSAFGVDQGEIEKNFLTAGLKMGEDAIKGVKAGIGGWHEPGGNAMKIGQKTGQVAAKTGMKLKPLVNTPGKQIAAGAGAGVGGGFMLGHKSDN